MSRDIVEERLRLVFPEGAPNRGYCVRRLVASTVFTMLYIGAVEGNDRYFAPRHVCRMTTEQADQDSIDDRDRYYEKASRPGFTPKGKRWYADNTREPVRDETLREGLVLVGAVVTRGDVATTSSAPRYALARDFAALFDPALQGDELLDAMAHWQDAHLTPGALARIQIQRSGAAAGAEGVLITFPNGETRRMAPGASSLISKAVVERFALRFLEKPAVLWLSESGNKVVTRDDQVATSIGLKIRADRDLPDMILADLGPAQPLLIFVEVVATDGAITPRRQKELLTVATEAGFKREHVLFLTAYQDRTASAFRKTVAQLAWDTLVWFASEPDSIVQLHGDARIRARGLAGRD